MIILKESIGSISKYTDRAKEIIKELNIKNNGEYSIWYRNSSGDNLVLGCEISSSDARKLVAKLTDEFGKGFNYDIMS